MAVKDVKNDASSAESTENTQNGAPKTTTNGTEAEAGEGIEQPADSVFTLTVNLPHEPKEIQLTVSTQEAVHDVRQSVTETPGTFQYSCFHLEHNGKKINDFVQISDIEGLAADPNPQVKLVEDPYTEKEARLHVVRVRELIGAAGDRTDTLTGILSGHSLHDSVTSAGEDSKDPHAMTGYDFEASGVLSTLLPRVQDNVSKTVKSISVSPWNPPPYHLRQKGHLLYLLLTTNEGHQHQITSHVSGFYINKSTNDKFDPSPRGDAKGKAAHSLLNLLTEISPSFDESFKKLQESNNLKEPLATFQITNATPATPWIVPAAVSPLTTHQADITRTQESYLISGIENSETLRDWNEEFQSTRELPKESIQDRVFRERLTSKLFADYNDAAARGAVLVARGEVGPLNPTEERDAQIFVYNNIFFSFGADGVGTFATEGGDEAARVATGKDVVGVRRVNQLDIDGLFTPGTVVVDYLGKRIVGQSVVPGIFKQREPEENQIDYGAVDGKDVVASDEKFVPVFQKLSKSLKVKSHPVWDKEGKRHDLEGSVETKGLLGTDGRKYVLDLYRITPLDICWMEEHGTAITSQEPADDAVKYPHRMTVLRAELVESYWGTKMREWVNAELQKRKTSKDGSEAKQIEAEPSKQAEGSSTEVSESKDDVSKEESKVTDQIDLSKFSFSLNPDAFSGQEPQTEEEKKEWAEDEREVRLASEFLQKNVLPALVRDLKEGEIGFPMDGQSLTQLLHKRGINLRYLGKLAKLSEEENDGKKLKSLRILTVQEMISRGFKHVAGKYLRSIPIPLTAACAAHLLNCLLGTGLNPHPEALVDESLAELYSEDLEFQNVTPEKLRNEIEEQIRRRFQYTIEKNWVSELKPLQLLREVSLKLGLQLEMKDYNFTQDSEPATNGAHLSPNGANGHSTSNSSKNKKKKARRDGSPASIAPSHKRDPHTFSPDDILNIVPIIKDASPKSALAEEALEAGRISIMQKDHELGQELLMESLSLHEQIYGIIHPEVARVYNTLSQMYYQLEQKDAAVELARKAVIVSERTLGVDNVETLLNYLNLGLFCHSNGDTKLALRYLKHALELWKVIYGSDHPDSITTMNNAAVMIQHLRDYPASRAWFEEALKTCESVYGKQSINAATIHFQLAQALALESNSKDAVSRMVDSRNIFAKELGEDDKNYKEAASWVEKLTKNAVSMAKMEQRAGAHISSRLSLGRTQRQPPVGQKVATAGMPAVLVDHDAEMARRIAAQKSSPAELAAQIAAGSDSPSGKKTGRGNPKRRGGAK